ncbi:ATP-dependent DNA helicase [Bengtsoniella intestinalis]|uniref:ATP-dependent DNA helicase n=1 Tax=Bengtsoniella intestinalis TaxID=3073143 RepID=UPI00391FA96A
MNTLDQQKIAHQQIDHIFTKLFPTVGMTVRQSQIHLAHTMFDHMVNSKISLNDAGTGSGKTYAYLVASIVFIQYRANCGLYFAPVIISTSSIALQNAVLREYLPLLSRVLVADEILDNPIRAVVRKGKRHYVCDVKLARTIRKLSGAKKNKEAARAIRSLQYRVDVDGVSVTPFDHQQICVPPKCQCRHKDCRYKRFIHGCQTEQYHFQICNHNYLIADGIHRDSAKPALFPSPCTVIVDEAHKLPETARQMFGVSLTSTQIPTLIRHLREARQPQWAETLRRSSLNIYAMLSTPWDEAITVENYQQKLLPVQTTLEGLYKALYPHYPLDLLDEISSLLNTVSLLSANQSKMVCYTSEDESNRTQFCATSVDLTSRLKSTLWNQNRPFIMTSGTLAVGHDFRRFKELAGLVEEVKVVESVLPSAFDYGEHCMLYLPDHPLRLDGDAYAQELAEEIRSLCMGSHGHALVLFTSYATMTAVKQCLAAEPLPYPLFTLGKNNGRTLDQFRATPGAVLFATGSAWEGMDFPGDCVSLLIIPRLPFPFPDALKEREKEQYPTLQEFIQSAVIPEMQMKLRQGFGRAIRTETDTCVVAILDERATDNGRYHHEVLTALPDIPVTDQDWQIEAFLRRTKEDSYFEEGRL